MTVHLIKISKKIYAIVALGLIMGMSLLLWILSPRIKYWIAMRIFSLTSLKYPKSSTVVMKTEKFTDDNHAECPAYVQYQLVTDSGKLADIKNYFSTNYGKADKWEADYQQNAEYQLYERSAGKDMHAYGEQVMLDYHMDPMFLYEGKIINKFPNSKNKRRVFN